MGYVEQGNQIGNSLRDYMASKKVIQEEYDKLVREIRQESHK